MLLSVLTKSTYRNEHAIEKCSTGESSNSRKPSPSESCPVPHCTYTHFRGSCNIAYSQLTDFRTAINWVVISPSDMVHFIQSQEVIYLIKIKVIKIKATLMNTTYHVRYVLYHIAGDTWKECQWLFLHLLYDVNINLLMEFPLMKNKKEKKKKSIEQIETD